MPRIICVILLAFVLQDLKASAASEAEDSRDNLVDKLAHKVVGKSIDRTFKAWSTQGADLESTTLALTHLNHGHATLHARPSFLIPRRPFSAGVPASAFAHIQPRGVGNNRANSQSKVLASSSGSLLRSSRRAQRSHVAGAATQQSPLATGAFLPIQLLASVVNFILTIAKFLFYPILVSIVKWLDTPKRPYSESKSVGNAYDDWTRDGVLEHYWGEHIHMGSYTESWKDTDLAKQEGYRKKDDFVTALFRATYGWLTGGLKNFVEAKLDFSAEMLDWSGAKSPKKILDVGCGIGGTSRYLAKRFPDAEVLGITLSPEQVARATKLAEEAGLKNAKFQVTDALNMSFADNTFDLVWGCESGEHMPDKKRYIEEMSRVLAPSGNMVVATWCERDPTPAFTPQERKDLDFLYEEWAHPYFISINAYGELMKGTKRLDNVETADWTEQTLPSWRHSIWVGVWKPWFWMKMVARQPAYMLNFIREVYTLEKYHKAMRDGLLQYGMMKATKPR